MVSYQANCFEDFIIRSWRNGWRGEILIQQLLYMMMLISVCMYRWMDVSMIVTTPNHFPPDPLAIDAPSPFGVKCCNRSPLRAEKVLSYLDLIRKNFQITSFIVIFLGFIEFLSDKFPYNKFFPQKILFPKTVPTAACTSIQWLEILQSKHPVRPKPRNSIPLQGKVENELPLGKWLGNSASCSSP